MPDFNQFMALDPIVQAAAQQNKVDPLLIHRMIRQESGGRAGAISPKGAQGLMQLMPETGRGLGVTDPNDPTQNINAGTKYFAQQMKAFGGDPQKALAAYNAGPGNVLNGRAARFPETQNYTSRILNGYTPQAVMAEAPANAGSTPPTASPSPPAPDFDAFMSRQAPVAAQAAQAPAAQAQAMKPTAHEPGFAQKAASFMARNFTPLGAADKIMAHPKEMLATLGAMAAVPLTGGASLPAAIAAAGLGGAGGAGLGMIADAARNGRGPSTAAGVGKEMLMQGGQQAGAELVGGGIVGPVMQRGARVLMDNAVRPTETILKEFPNVIDTIIKERLPVGRILGKSGSQQAKAALRGSAQNTRGILREADAAGVQVQPGQLTQGLPGLRAEAAKSAGLPGGGDRGLADMEADFAISHGTPKTPTQVKDLKVMAQSLAKPVFRAERQGNMVGADQSMAARFNDAIAGSSRQALENVPQFGPRIAESEARTQGLIGATQALRKAEARRLPLWSELASTAVGAAAGAASGNPLAGLGSALAVRALSSPRTASRLALAADSAAPLAAQGPRLAALIAALLNGEEQK